MIYISGLDPNQFWSDAVVHRAHLQLYIPLPGRKTPFELATGERPNVAHIRIFGCEALSYIEKDKRFKFDPKTEKCIYLGHSDIHKANTYKLYNLRTGKILYRRNVVFNERSFPARTDVAVQRSIGAPDITEAGEELIGKDFKDDGEDFKVAAAGFEKGLPVVYYQSSEGAEYFSAVQEVRKWTAATQRAREARTWNGDTRIS